MDNYLEYLKNISNEKTFNRKTDYIKYNFSRYLNINKKKLILEIGPGNGELVNYLNSQGIITIDIIDNNRNILKYIQENYKIRNSFFTEKLITINSKLKNYDYIILTQIFEHIPKEQYINIFRMLYSHLNSNGYLIITVPNAGNPLNLYERYSDLSHYTSFTENSLRQLVITSKIKNYAVEIVGFKIPPCTFLNIGRIILQKILHLIFFSLFLINGGVYPKLYHPNITLIIKKIRS